MSQASGTDAWNVPASVLGNGSTDATLREPSLLQVEMHRLHATPRADGYENLRWWSFSIVRSLFYRRKSIRACAAQH